MSARTFSVCYLSFIDGAHIPFADFTRRELREAFDCFRRMGQSHALKSDWILKRDRKVIARYKNTPHRGLTAMQARGEVMEPEACASATGRGGNAAPARAAGPASISVVGYSA